MKDCKCNNKRGKPVTIVTVDSSHHVSGKFRVVSESGSAATGAGAVLHLAKTEFRD